MLHGRTSLFSAARVPATRGARAALLAALGALHALTGCGRDDADPAGEVARPSVVVITIDTVRADALGCYGGPPDVTPALDALATESVRFDAARATSPITLPSHASMFTGLYPPRHALRDNGLVSLSDDADTTAEALAAAGYQTAAFIGAVVLDRSYGLDQGFDTYDEPERSLKIQSSKIGFFVERKAVEMEPKIAAWLDARDRDRPFFLWVHFYDAHQPLEPEPELFERVGNDAYLAEVAAVDRAIGRIVERLRTEGVLDDTLVAVVSDHGEDFHQHGEPTHGLLIYDSVMRVPFLLRLPGAEKAGSVVDGSVSVADLHPTILDAVGLELPRGIDGQSLLAPLDEARGVYLESYGGYLNYGWHPIAGWAQQNDKTIFSSRVQLYDTAADPGELQNLWTPNAAAPVEHRARIAAVLALPALEPSRGEVDSDQLAKLQALGYAGTGFAPEQLPSPLDSSQRPDPHDSLPELALVQRGVDLSRNGRYDEAALLLDSVVERNPGNLKAMQALGGTLSLAGRFEDASYWLERLEDAGLSRPEDLANLAYAYEKTGRLDRADAFYRRALSMQETNLTAVRGLVRLTKDDPKLAAEHEAYKARARALRGLEPEDPSDPAQQADEKDTESDR